jgi:hypothetical protein
LDSAARQANTSEIGMIEIGERRMVKRAVPPFPFGR